MVFTENELLAIGSAKEKLYANITHIAHNDFRWMLIFNIFQMNN
jgi:hypothetical protein